jgi:DNA primase catalytic subunit
MTDPIQQFYRTAQLDLNCLSDLPHRHFRLFLNNGRFLKIDERIRDETRLRKWLVRFAPNDVYYSVSCWLNPEVLGSRYGTPLTSNIILSSDLVFDIDRSPFSIHNLEDAKKDTIRLLGFLRENNYTIRYCAFSGSKGFHVVAHDPERYPCANPFDRESLAIKARFRLLDRITSEGIVVDRKVTPDTRRILRLPGTINSKTGYICTILNDTQVQLPVKEILNRVLRVSLSAPRIPLPGDDAPLRGRCIIQWLLNRFGVRLGAPDFSYASYATNRVPGIRCMIPFFEFSSRMGLTKAEKILLDVQAEYNLSDIYLFTSESCISALSLRTFQYRRIAKIVRASGSRDYGSFLKFRHQFFRVGNRTDSAGRIIEPAPSFVKTLLSDKPANKQFVSHPHWEFLRSFDVPVREYPNAHGWGEVMMTHTIIEH